MKTGENRKDASISGTHLKMNVHIDPLGSLHMSDYDFECKFYIFPKKSVIIPKSDMIKIDDDNYLVMVNTENLGVGRLHLQLIAQIPDQDFRTQVRKEVVCVDTNVDIVNC